MQTLIKQIKEKFNFQSVADFSVRIEEHSSILLSRCFLDVTAGNISTKIVVSEINHGLDKISNSLLISVTKIEDVTCDDIVDIFICEGFDRFKTFMKYLSISQNEVVNTTLAECPVECLQHESELQEFLELYRELKPKNILEIGTFFGGTLWFFIKNNPELKRFTVVDMPIPHTDNRHAQMISSRNQWAEWTKDIDFHEWSGDSHNVGLINNIKFENPENDIDMLHIDGDHTYEGVKADYENYKSLVKPGGIIVFHDVTGIDTVAQFWNEIKQQYPETRQRLISHEGGWGIGILYV